MRHRKLVTVVAFAAATAVGCIVVRKLRQRVSTCCTGALPCFIVDVYAPDAEVVIMAI